jgi:hypothetical protein
MIEEYLSPGFNVSYLIGDKSNSSNEQVSLVDNCIEENGRITSFLKNERKFSDDVKQIVFLSNEKGTYRGIYSEGVVGGNYFILKAGLKDKENYWFYNNKYYPVSLEEKPYITHYENKIKNIKSDGRAKDLEILLDNISKRIRALKSLPNNWDSYDAKEVTWDAFCKAGLLFSEIILKAKTTDIPQPFIAPISNGGLKIEWETIRKQLYFIIPPSNAYNWEYSTCDSLTGLESKKYFESKSGKEIIDLALDWFLQHE